MNRKFILLLSAPLLLGISTAWAQDAELPGPADDEARRASDQLPDAAAAGLTIAGENTAGLPAEATIRLMDDADEENGGAVTNDVQLPILPDEGVAGQQGLDTAADAIAGQDSFGFDAAAKARDTASDMAESTQSGIEARGRADDLPVDVPGRPEIPEVPPTPGQ